MCTLYTNKNTRSIIVLAYFKIHTRNPKKKKYTYFGKKFESGSEHPGKDTDRKSFITDKTEFTVYVNYNNHACNLRTTERS